MATFIIIFHFLYASTSHFLAAISGQKDCVKWLPNFSAASFHSCFLLALADFSRAFRSFRVFGLYVASVVSCLITHKSNRLACTTLLTLLLFLLLWFLLLLPNLLWCESLQFQPFLPWLWSPHSNSTWWSLLHCGIMDWGMECSFGDPRNVHVQVQINF